MAKKNAEPNTTPTETTGKKTRQRGKVSWLTLIAPFIPGLSKYAQEQYEAGRFDKDVSDADLKSRDKLREVLANFPIPPAQKGGEPA